MSIAGGSDEINKNVIGERALGLPREPDANKGLPYREVLARTEVGPVLTVRPSQLGTPRPAVVEQVVSHRQRGSSVMGRKYQVISGDGHLETPPDFVAFLPEKYKDRAPKLIRLPDGGGDAWLMEGMPLTYASQNLRGRGKVKFAGQSYFKDDGSRTDGAGDGLQRLREQDEDGIDAELLFVPVFASRFLEKIADHDAYLAMVQAYNDWLADYCSVAPDRLIGNALMPISGIDDAIAELERARRDGLQVGAAAEQSPNGGNGPKPEDDRFWEKALELEMALSPHMSFAGVMNIGGPRHDTSQWPVEAGMTQHARRRPGAHDGAADRRTARSSGSRS